ncbi:MAG: hypothetical protein KF752_09485 [Pirellulaceae bacterium]|nr:hypothetical protein [Pirellulaceae bacterium]
MMTNDEDPDWLAYLQQMQREAERKMTLAAQYAIQLLRRHKLPCVMAQYCGCGDSGQVESLTVLKLSVDRQQLLTMGIYADGKQCGLDKRKTRSLGKLPFPEDFPKALSSTLFGKASLEDCLIALVEHMTPDSYEINEGGQGVVIFDAHQGMAHCLHGSNYIEIQYDCQSVEVDPVAPETPQGGKKTGGKRKAS